MMDINKIKALLPHRYPFLLVDRIIELVPGEKAVGIKNLTINEPYFPGHFPDRPLMPGVLMIEAMAQVGACALLCQEEYRGKLGFLAGVNNIRFRNFAIPGDTLYISCSLIKMKRSFGWFKGEITIDQNRVCQGEIMFALESER